MRRLKSITLRCICRHLKGIWLFISKQLYDKGIQRVWWAKVFSRYKLIIMKNKLALCSCSELTNFSAILNIKPFSHQTCMFLLKRLKPSMLSSMTQCQSKPFSKLCSQAKFRAQPGPFLGSSSFQNVLVFVFVSLWQH